VPRRRRLGEGALGLAAQGRKPVVVPDYPAWPGALDLGGRMPASVLAVPLMSGRQSIGGLAVASRTKREFDEQDVQLLFLLAAQAAPALEQAALFERLQAANEELRRASEVKDSFLASMSHELRTPLNAILGFSELLIDYPDESPEVRQEYLRTIYSSGQHLLNLINDLLDVAKIEAGKMDVQPESITLSPLVSDVVTSLASLSAAKGIAVRVDVPSRLRVWADLRHVRQILINLLSNAFKFTASGGAVSVTAAEQGAVVAIRVVDTGIGIAAEHLAGIFDQFTQVRQAGVVTQGTGLGLALTKRLCELNGGLIDVRSEVGRGSVFTVRLPVAADAGEEPEPGGPADGPGKLVLVVEDDPASAELLERQLRRGGYEVAVANRGADALELAATRRPLAVTLDLMLPDLDGWDVLRSLKANVRTRDLPVIVVSVLDDHRRAQALGAVDFLQKPIDAPLLLASLARFAPPAGDGPRRVLAIDDDPAVLEVVRRALSRAGFEVMTARGGAEGLEIARSERPGLIVVDLLMPEVDGFEVIARLRADAATKDAAILVLTSREVTPEEKVRLNGKVAAILRKGEPAGADLLAWVRRIDAARDGDS
jgi:signal transduction histidine kinase/CheY-like chemotaxis protein